MATTAHCAYCFEVLLASFEGGSALPLSAFSKAIEAESSSSSLESSASPTSSSGTYRTAASATDGQMYPMFVTWNTVTSRGGVRLRGCIGTFEAQPLEKGLASYAKIAAFEDTRFNPISAKELPTLECGVSLLTDFEDAADPLDWTFGTHGLRISFVINGRRYSATYLPDVPPEHFDSKEETLGSLVLKSGYSGAKKWDQLGIKLVRYQSSKAKLGYPEFAALKKRLGVV
ncbi:AMMECR1 domain-containing protein [Myxozyma melibiosi]|uniref:AMMECR1 domain-containing protein n=1 Tax=Myxozyma melibiosi TaxID=54550 RepID=A0ABR1EZ86_9ASCO